MAEPDPMMLSRPSDAEIEERIETAVEEFRKAAFWRAGQLWGNNRWLGVQALKGPWDVWIAQEILWETRPGSRARNGRLRGRQHPLLRRHVRADRTRSRVGVDVDLAGAHSRVKEHPRVTLFEGSSVNPEVVDRIREEARGKRVMVNLDSDHKAEHVHQELCMLADLVTPGCYLVVEDTAIGKPLGKHLLPGPAEALEEWLADGQPFEVDRSREKFLLTASPGGYLRRLEPDAQAS